MKANAKKLLALILAMVMSLSLAAPAMAAAGDGMLKVQSAQTATASDVATITDVWKIEYDDVTGSYKIYDSKELKAAGEIANSDKTAKKQTNGAVTVTWDNADDYLIGGTAGVPVYTATYKKDGKEVKFAGLKVGTAGTVRSLEDSDVKWTALTGSDAVFALPSTGSEVTYGRVEGSYFTETKSDGTVNYYFKLKQANKGNTSFTSTELYFVAPNAAPSDIEKALQNAVECNDLGKVTGNKITDKDKPAYVTTKKEDYKSTTYNFTVTNPVDLTVKTGADATLTELVSDDTVKFDTDKKSGTILVTIENTTKDNEHFFIATAAEAQEIIEKQFKDANVKNFAVESVTGPQGNSFTVTLKKVEGAKDVETGKWTKNVMTNGKTAVLMNDAADGFYNGADRNGKDGEMISAGKVATGRVVVRWAEVPSAAKTGYKTKAGEDDAVANLKKLVEKGYATVYSNKGKHPELSPTQTKADENDYFAAENIDTIVFKSVDYTKNVFYVTDCAQGTTVPYSELKLNAVVGGKLNPFVTVYGKVQTSDGREKNEKVKLPDKAIEEWTASELITASTKAVDTSASYGDSWWYSDDISSKVVKGSYTYAPKFDYETVQKAFVTANASFVNKGSIEVSAANHQDLVEVVEITKEATCQTPGEKVTKKVCSKCKKPVGTPKVEVIPTITDPVEKNTIIDPTDTTGERKKMIFDEDEIKKGVPTTKHYLTKAVPTTTTSEDGMTTTTTIDYYCNFNVKHPEVTQSWTVTKTELQHSGRWNHVILEKNSEIEILTDGATLFSLLKKITIADSDIENANIIMNRTGEQTPNRKHDSVIEVALGNNIGGWTYADGVYTKSTMVNINSIDGSVPVYETVKGIPSSKYYAATITVSNVNEPKFKYLDDRDGIHYCDDGSLTISAVVYEIKKDAEGGYNTAAIQGTSLANNLKKGKVVVVNDKFKETVTLTGTGHKYFNDDGVATELCTHCGTKKESETPVANVIDPANVVVKDLTWTGKLAQPKVTVKDADGFALIKGTDYVVSEIDATDVGEYSITIKGLNEYAGNKFTKTFKINKAAATLKKKSAPGTLTANKKKAVTGQIKMTVKGGKVAKYKVTKKVAGVSVNKSGKITVKKGNKKAGTLKVKVTMTPDANHTAAKAVTVKVAIKAAKK